MSEFAQRLLAWQREHGRHGLPWQQSADPYRVWLSEIMLQQTQVDTVIPYYARFLARFPDLATLAAAPQEAVLALWSGLGYYARARNLHRAAQQVMREHGGVFPQQPEQIERLPGIGRSTAAAIAAFCFGARVAILDGNVKRVLARHFLIEGFPGQRAVEQAMWALAQSLLPAAECGRYAQALMDLGALVCKRGSPTCAACPLRSSCGALAQGRQRELPQPRPRKQVPERTLRLLLARSGAHVLLWQRPALGVWGGLFAAPEIPPAQAAETYAHTLGLRPLARAVALPERLHTLTHFRMRIQASLLEVEASTLHSAPWCWAAAEDLATLGLPTPMRHLLAEVFKRPP